MTIKISKKVDVFISFEYFIFSRDKIKYHNILSNALIQMRNVLVSIVLWTPKPSKIMPPDRQTPKDFSDSFSQNVNIKKYNYNY